MAEKSGIRLEVEFDDDGLQDAIAAMLKRTATLEPVFDEIGSMLNASAEQRFLDEEGPDGVAWPELADSTMQRRGDSARKLRDKGLLFQSLTYSATRLGLHQGSNKVYARIHQLGGEAGRGKSVEIPARPYLGVSQEDGREILRLFGVHLVEA